jgi:hypothetical protein
MLVYDPLRGLQRRSVSNSVSNAGECVHAMANLSDKKCYGVARFGRQKAPVNRKYGHDTQGVAGSSPARPTTILPRLRDFRIPIQFNFAFIATVVSNDVSNAKAGLKWRVRGAMARVRSTKDPLMVSGWAS